MNSSKINNLKIFSLLRALPLPNRHALPNFSLSCVSNPQEQPQNIKAPSPIQGQALHSFRIFAQEVLISALVGNSYQIPQHLNHQHNILLEFGILQSHHSDIMVPVLCIERRMRQNLQVSRDILCQICWHSQIRFCHRSLCFLQTRLPHSP